MPKLGKLTLNGTPRVAVSVKDKVSPASLKSIKRYGVDIVEIRIDLYSSFNEEYVLNEIWKLGSYPCIATIRSKREGGRWSLSEERRKDLFMTVLPYVDGIDIELSSREILKDIVRSAHKAKKLVIISHHDFKKTPSVTKLSQILQKAKTAGADIVKIAAMAVKSKDVEKLAGFTLAHRSKKIITVAMGKAGAISRVFFPALGSLVTYASLGSPTAPGQMDYHKTVNLLKKILPSRS